MSLIDNLTALAGAIGQDIKTINSNIATVESSIGNMPSLSTSERGSLVLAINELVVKTDQMKAQDEQSQQQFTQKLQEELRRLKDELVGGASDALDTFKELEDALATKSAASAVTEGLAKKIDKDDIGDTSLNFVNYYNNAKNI